MCELLRKARKDEAEEILRLYRSAASAEGCTWDDNYPSAETVEADLTSGGLYVLEAGGTLAGCVSVCSERELDGLDCWQVREEHCEIARVAIHRTFQGRGLSVKMLLLLFRELSASGVRSVHILAAEQNLTAQRTYKSLGFSFYGKYRMFGHCFTAAEKIL